MRRCIPLALLFISVLAHAQSGTLPETAPGRLFRGWLESFNAGDLQRHAKFLADHDSSADRQGLSPDEAARRQLGFRAMVGGGFDVYKIVDSTPTKLVALLKERGGWGWAEATFEVDPAKPDVIIASDFQQARAPVEVRPAREDQAHLVSDAAALLDKLAAKDQFSGVVLMAKDGKPFFEKAYGYANREHKIRNRVDTKFKLGSMNKMFTSVAIAQLVQRGKLKYTDTVAKLLPDYPNRDAASKITVAHLLSHTSGLGDFFGPEFDKKKDHITELKDYLQFFADKPLQFEPGKGWAYSNAGMIVAGLIIERVSGENYFSYVRRHIYRLAGMMQSGTWPKTRHVPNEALGYTATDGKLANNYKILPLMGSSAGGGDSTAPDLLKFHQALQAHKLVNAELTDTITTPKAKTDGPDQYAYGFSVTSVDGKRVVGHGGGAPGMNTQVDMYWDSGYTVVVLSNLDPPIAQRIAEYIRQRIQQ